MKGTQYSQNTMCFAWIFCLFLSSCFVNGHSATLTSVIPFNLPNARFCKTCTISENLLSSEAISDVDAICKTYVEALSKEKDINIQQTQLLENLIEKTNNQTWIFYAFIKSRFIFESVFQKQYSFQVYVEIDASANAAYCVHAYIEGEGFSTIKSKYEMTPLIEEGFNFESIYVNGVIDMWITEKCDVTKHNFSVQAAKARLRSWEKKAASWNMHPFVYGTKYLGFPLYNNSTVSKCGDNNQDKPGSSECNDIYCNMQYKRTKLDNGLPNKQNEETDRTENECPNTSNSAASTRCRRVRKNRNQPTIIIHEIKPCRPGMNRNEFIELRRIPHTENEKVLIQNSKLVAFTAHSLKLLIVMNLRRIEFNNKGFALIADKTDSRFQGANDQDLENFEILPCSTTEPIIIMLLTRDTEKTSTKLWDEISLRGRRDRGFFSRYLRSPLPKHDQITLLEVIKNSVSDAYVYGQLTNQQFSTELLEMLHVTSGNCNFILSPGNPQNADENNLSLNLCPPNPEVISPYSPRFFKLGMETPGEENNCDSRMEFQTDQFEQGEDLEIVGVTYDADYNGECPVKNSKTAEINRIIDFETHFIRRLQDGSEYQNKYTPISSFADNAWKSLLRVGFDSTSPDFPDITPYVLVPPTENEVTPLSNRHWRCEVCSKRLSICPQSFGPGKKDGLTSKGGVAVPTNSRRAKDLLVRHINSNSHHLSVLLDIKNDRTNIMVEKQEQYKTPENMHLLPIANRMRTTFTLVKTNTAMVNIKIWHDLLQELGSNVGEHGFTGQSSATIIRFIASTGQSNLIKYMMINNLPFSIILDGSSDRRNVHYVLLYIQCLEGENTVPFFAGLLRLGKGATAEDHIRELKLWVANYGDEYEAYFKDQIVAVITDAAAVMQKFHNLVSQWVNHVDDDGAYIPLIKINCLAHKLQLTTRSTIVPLKSDEDYGVNSTLSYLQEIEKFVQSTHTWISIAQRRLGEYREIVEIHNLPRVELKTLHTNRWISSSHGTLHRFITAWRGVMYTMEAIVEDTVYRKQIRDEAENFAMQLHDKRKLITMVFLQDYTSVFKRWSLNLQQFSGVMSDQVEYFDQLHHDLSVLEIFEGTALQSFLQKCKCSSDTVQLGCTLEEYEQSDEIEWEGNLFTTIDDEAPLISTLGKDVIEKTRKRLEAYMPVQFIRATSVISPKRLPPGRKALDLQGESLDQNREIPVYGKEEIEYLGIQFGMKTSTLLHDWSMLLNYIVTLPSWDLYRRDLNTESFWAKLLRKKDVPWTELTRKFIRALKILAPGSTLCESGFSIFNVVKNQRRSQIADNNLQAILSIIVNGPEDISGFDAFGYAERWYLSGRSSESAQTERPGECKIADFEEDREEIMDEDEDIQSNELFGADDISIPDPDSPMEDDFTDEREMLLPDVLSQDDNDKEKNKVKAKRVRSLVYGNL